MSTPTIYLVGSGTSRIDPRRGQTRACVIDGDTTFAIDLGFGSLERLEQLGGFDVCSTLHIHISHRHTDHLIGIFPLLQCLTYSDDRRHLAVNRVVIHATSEVCNLIEAVRSVWGPHETSLSSPMRGTSHRRIEYQPGPDYQDWSYTVGGLHVQSVHLADSNNHGVSFSVGGTRYAFTADATVFSDELVEFCKDASVCVFDFGHLTNIRQEDGSFVFDQSQAVSLLSRANPRKMYACHIYLRYLQEQLYSRDERKQEIARIITSTSTAARESGFTGQLIVGEDGMAL